MNNLLKFIIGVEVMKVLIPIPFEELFTRYYLGKYKVMVYERILNKSYVKFLEKGIVGNKKVGYREIGEMLFVYTRTCWRVRK